MKDVVAEFAFTEASLTAATAEQPVSAKPTAEMSGVTVSPLTGGPGLRGRVGEGAKTGISDGVGNDAPSIFIRSRATGATAESAVSGDVYVGFTLTPADDKALSLFSLSFDWAIGNGPVDSTVRTVRVFVRSSVDDFKSDLNAEHFVDSYGGKGETPFRPAKIDLPAEQFGRLDRAVEFRIYVYDDTSSSLVARFDNVMVRGAVVAR